MYGLEDSTLRAEILVYCSFVSLEKWADFMATLLGLLRILGCYGVNMCTLFPIPLSFDRLTEDSLTSGSATNDIPLFIISAGWAVVGFLPKVKVLVSLPFALLLDAIGVLELLELTFPVVFSAILTSGTLISC